MELDVSGLVCPQPVAVVRRCLQAMDPGDELVVVGDYPPAERSIRRTCYKHGFAVGDGPSQDGKETFSVRIRVTEAAAASMRDAEESVRARSPADPPNSSGTDANDP